MAHTVSVADLRCLFGGMTREELESLLTQLAAIAPKEFDTALRVTAER